MSTIARSATGKPAPKRPPAVSFDYLSGRTDGYFNAQSVASRRGK